MIKVTAKPSIKVIDKGAALIRNRLALLGEHEVWAGVQDREAARPRPGGATNGELAKWHQFGTEDIPATRFMDLAAANIPREIRRLAQKAAKRTARKSRAPVRNALRPIGKAAAGEVRDAVVEAGLVGSGRLRDSVTYTVRLDRKVVERGKP